MRVEFYAVVSALASIAVAILVWDLHKQVHELRQQVHKIRLLLVDRSSVE